MAQGHKCTTESRQVKDSITTRGNEIIKNKHFFAPAMNQYAALCSTHNAMPPESQVPYAYPAMNGIQGVAKNNNMIHNIVP